MLARKLCIRSQELKHNLLSFLFFICLPFCFNLAFVSSAIRLSSHVFKVAVLMLLLSLVIKVHAPLLFFQRSFVLPNFALMNEKPYADLFKLGNCFSSTFSDRRFFYVGRLIYSKTRLNVFGTFAFYPSLLHSVAKTSCCTDGVLATTILSFRTLIVFSFHLHS